MPLEAQLRELGAVVDGERRYIDLGLEVRGPAGDLILTAGGCWDSLLGAFVDRPHTRHVVRVTRAQEQAARQLAAWLIDYDQDKPERIALDIYVDRRRGGKTFFCCLFVLVFVLRYPRSHLGPTLGWIVCPTYPQQREILETMAKILPAAWLREGGAFKFHKTDRTFSLPTGAELALRSADRPQTLKAGGVACIAVNEAAQCSVRAILHCLGNNIDAGGITVLALNPPDSVIGLWAEKLHEAIEGIGVDGAPVLDYVRETPFPPNLNDALDQHARTRFSTLARILDPAQEKRDGQGLWVTIRDRCYPFWDRKRHLLRGPQLEEVLGWQDITTSMNALTYTLAKGDLRPFGIGMDFQGKPWSGAVLAKAFAAPAENPYGIPVGLPVYVFLEDCHNDIEIGQWWTEQMLCQEILARGWAPQTALVIGDGTGNKQGATGPQRGEGHNPQLNSFPLVREYGYQIHAPIEREVVTEQPGRGRRFEVVCSNPLVPTRLNLIYDLLETSRLFVAEKARDLAESFRTCEAKDRHPHGWGAHLTDAGGYLLYRWETGWKDSRRLRR